VNDTLSEAVARRLQTGSDQVALHYARDVDLAANMLAKRLSWITLGAVESLTISALVLLPCGDVHEVVAQVTA
jgi:hypothetical protein